ncbi:MAG: protoporphyrinogen oxidase [Betaproteobacteria bacterium]|nr:protoporphyrinogen oxidase [Betaproteobacteria bacterium]
MADVAVIGAGISGLTVAHALRDTGHEVVVLDKENRSGGRMRSERIEGFLMEHGPNGMAFPAPCAERLIGESGLAEQAITGDPDARHRYIVRRGRARRLAQSARGILASGLVSPAGCLRVLLEPFVSVRHGDETIADFARRRFGREFLDYVMDPLTAGICAGNPEQLSVSAVFPRLKQLERRHGSVVLAAIASRLRQRAGAAPCNLAKRELLSFRDGLGALPQAISLRIAGRVLLGTQVESVQRAPGGGFMVMVRERRTQRSLKADSVVIALPAYAAAGVVDRLDAGVAGELAQIEYPPMAVAFLGYRAQGLAGPLDGAGMLAPAVEARDVLGMLFSSTLFAGRAPPGHVALTAFIGGARQPQLALLDPREIGELAHAEARRLSGVLEAPVVARVRCWRHGLPQTGLGHAARLNAVAALEREQPGLFFTGNYFCGVSAPACIQQASVTAERVRSYLAPASGRGRRERLLRPHGLPDCSEDSVALRPAFAGTTSPPT